MPVAWQFYQLALHHFPHFDMSKLRLLALCAALVPSLTAAQAPAKQVIVPEGQRPNPNLSPAIKVGNVVYASGQLGMGNPPDSTIEGQTRRALDNTKRVIEAAGATMADVVRCTVFLTRASDFQGMNGVYREYFPKDPPARSTVVVAALVSAAAIVEIECTAVLTK
jgi:2-iminobutanoate/2-iminopropanoate deaminase